MSKPFKEKIALVTGGSFGIGKQAAIEFAQRGAKVILCDVINGKDTVEAINKNHGEAVFMQCDVSKEDQVKDMLEKIIRDYGKIDYAFNNAGIEGESAPTHQSSIENWNKVIDINLKGIWLCMKHEIKQMVIQGHGAIVNNSSIAGLVGFEGITAYVASKHGVLGLTKTAALEYAKQGIRVNAICPGVIKTPMLDRSTAGDQNKEKAYANMEPNGRIGTPKEIAEAAVWLCSDAASFITGTALAVDGGWTAK
jgi:NAD(P)-dependent dehydrogenase (short-subunit alcohol dehydrogenase family)